MATPILRYSPGGPALRTVTPPPSVSALTVETEEETVNPGNPTPIIDYSPGSGPAVPPWPPLPSDLTYPECGTIQLVDGQEYIDVTFANEKPDANWIFEELQVTNTTDSTPLNIWPGIVTEKTITGFRLQINGLPDTDNYFLHWAVGGCATSDWVVSSGATTTNFLQLTDTPDEYTGQAGMGVKVNATEDGLEFGIVSGSSGAVINVLDYGVIADHQTLTDITMTGGSAMVHSPSYTFTEADVGKYVVVRGAVGATDSISPLHGTIVNVVGGDAMLSQATSSFPVVGHVPRMDFGTDNVDAFRDAIQAMPAGGTVVIPAGRYFIGATTYDGVTYFHTVGFPWNGLFQDQFPATAAGCTLRGDGMGATRLYYSSGFVAVGVLSGCGLLVGLTPAGGYTGITISDFSIEDLNDFAVGGESIFVAGVDNFHMERVEMIDGKGNSAFNYQGASPHSGSPGGGAYGVNVFIRDCIVRGTADGNYVNGDGFNVGNVRNFHFTGNTIRGVQRHGFEGGGSCYDQFFENNYIDMDSQGGAGINPTGGSRTIVANNIILNVANGSTGIDFTNDVGGAFSILEEIVTGNYVTGGQYAVKFQDTGGAGPSAVNKYIVSNNWFDGCDVAVSTVGGVLIHNNRITNLGGAFGLSQGGSPASPIDAQQIIDIRGNVFDAGAIPCNVHQYTGFADDYQIKVEDNSIGGAMADAAGSGLNAPQYGNLGRVYSPGGGSIASGAVLTGLTDYNGVGVFYGARVDDKVEALRSGAWPKNLIYWAAVTADDTVTVYVFNPTSGAVAYPASDFIYYAVHRK